MKWKDSEEVPPQAEKKEEEFFDEEQYSPWAQGREILKTAKLDKALLFPALLALSLIASLASLLMLLFGRPADSISRQELTALSAKINQMEERLGKYDALQEKIAFIGEQARALDKSRPRVEKAEPGPAVEPAAAAPQKTALERPLPKSQTPGSAGASKSRSVHTHTVAAGDTLYSISKRYHIAIEQLLQINGLAKHSTLSIGQKLVVAK